jgi:hypothetical protein
MIAMLRNMTADKGALQNAMIAENHRECLRENEPDYNPEEFEEDELEIDDETDHDEDDYETTLGTTIMVFIVSVCIVHPWIEDPLADEDKP